MKKRILIAAFSFFANSLFAQWTTVCNTGNGFVDNFENYGSDLFATGFFHSLCGTNCNYVARFDGTTWHAAGNGFPHAGHHLQNIDNDLYGVAYQPNVDSNWVYKWDGNNFNKFGEGVYLTSAILGFSQTANLYNIIKYNSDIIACGEFDRVGAKQISGIMKWNGSEWDSLGSGLSGSINGTAPVMYPHDMCIYGNDLIVAGNFSIAGSQLVNGIARWDGNQWHSIGPGFNSTVYSVCVYNGVLYAGGDFTFSGNIPLHFIASWNGTTWQSTGFSLYYQSPLNYSFIHTMKVINGKLYISGGFDRALSGSTILQCAGIASYDGITVDSLSGGLPGKEVEAIALYNGLLYAGGGPTNSTSYIASYNIPTAIEENSFQSEFLIYPNPSFGDFMIDTRKEKVDIIVYDVTGKVMLKESKIDFKKQFHLDQPGFYFVTLKSNDYSKSKKLLVTKGTLIR
jgi:Secretion system C-terminal sorting domain